MVSRLEQKALQGLHSPFQVPQSLLAICQSTKGLSFYLDLFQLLTQGYVLLQGLDCLRMLALHRAARHCIPNTAFLILCQEKAKHEWTRLVHMLEVIDSIQYAVNA